MSSNYQSQIDGSHFKPHGIFYHLPDLVAALMLADAVDYATQLFPAQTVFLLSFTKLTPLQAKIK
jgi:hypothetical protein